MIADAFFAFLGWVRLLFFNREMELALIGEKEERVVFVRGCNSAFSFPDDVLWETIKIFMFSLRRVYEALWGYLFRFWVIVAFFSSLFVVRLDWFGREAAIRSSARCRRGSEWEDPMGETTKAADKYWHRVLFSLSLNSLFLSRSTT